MTTQTTFPEKTCDISRLVTHEKLVEAVLAGRKTQQRRDGIYAYPGEIFKLNGVEFIVTELKQQTLGDMTDTDARAEGFPDLNAYKALILRMHAGMKWNENHKVWIHTFKRHQ